MYALLPPRGQDLAVSGWGVKYRWDRLGPGFERAVSGFRERERWSSEQLGREADERLRAIVVHAFRKVPYYRDRWSREGVEEGDLRRITHAELRLLPSTPKDDVRADPEALVCRNPWRHGRILRQQTSGSTGTPTVVYMTAQNLREFTAIREARSFGWAGASIRLPRSTIGARLVVPQPASTGPFYRYNYVERQVYLSAWHISPAHLDDYIEGFDRYRPQVLTGLAHSYYLLAQLMLQAGRSLVYRPRAAIMGSEKLTADMRRAIAEAFRTRVFEEYGSVENCVLATECERGRLHLSPDLGALEVVDSKGDPVPAGEPGRFVCTGFLDYVQPLVRYEIGDIGVRSSEPCPCGRDHMPVLERIVGRENDALILRDGRRVATGEEILSGVAGVVEGQLVQEDFEEFTVKVVATPDFGEEQCRQIEAGLLSRVGEATVTVVRVDHLDRGPTGKFRPVVSKLTAPPATGTP